MVKTRRSVTGGEDDREYRKRRDNQDVSADGWSPRALRSHYRVTRKRQHWPTQLVSRRLRTIKMPRIMYPESEDTEAEKFSRRRRRPVRVFFKAEQRVCRVAETRPSGVVGRQLRPLQPNNYMEESDKPHQETESHVRRSGRQRKLIHHTFNESWITNDMKVKGYPRLYGMRRMSTSSESSIEEERTRPKRMSKRIDDTFQSGNEEQNEKEKDTNPSEKKTATAQPARLKKDAKAEEEKEKPAENGTANLDSDKESKKIDDKEASDDESEDKTLAATRRILRGRNNNQRRNLNEKKERMGTNSHSQRETGSESDNTSDSGSDIVVRRQLRRSNRTRKPRNNFIESASGDGKQYTMHKQPYNMRKPYKLRERKQPKIIVRSQSPNTSSSSSTSDSEEELNVSVKNKTKTKQKSKTLGEHNDRALREIQPIQLDGSIRFSSVGGLEDHIRCLREMVLFPLMYPQLFDKFGFHPPKGVLFHGPPGTGKTLLARALANECSIQGGQKVSFFMRKGADCLKKWVGESERNIKLLFQQASKMKPSIIFFDEIDALAPVRSARQDQVHTSVVGTLLAEMDGVCDRGQIIVIGATNRLDAVDPALRRAGRFDRELHFPHPAAHQRASILRVLTSSWDPPSSDETIKFIANITNGYGGSDLKALCSESILKALERTYPQVYKSQHALLIDPQKVEVLCEDMINAMKGLVAAGSRSIPPPSRPLPTHLIPLLSTTVDSVIAHVKRVFPPANKPSDDTQIREPNSFLNHHWSSVFLLKGACSSTFIGPAILTEIEHCAVRELSVSALHQGVSITVEQALLSLFSEIRRCSQGRNSCIIYVPSIDLLWPLLGDSGSNLVIHLWEEISAANNCLLLATYDGSYDDLPEQVHWLFPAYKDCIHDIKEPEKSNIHDFLRPLFMIHATEPPHIEIESQFPELPKAPPPPAPRPTALELRRNARREAHVLRELRIFLRDVCRKLAANRRFYKFTKPVDLEEVTDYLTIIKEPMDLETMMTKVDMHRYLCARDFLQDVDLICANALEYNPDRTSSDKQIRHEACSLRDHAYSLVDVEMDTDFEEECRAIASNRVQAGISTVDQELPSFIYTAANPIVKDTKDPSPCDPPQETNDIQNIECEMEATQSTLIDSLHSTSSSKRKRRKKQSMWSKGMVAKKPKMAQKDGSNPIITDEESKENKPMCTSPVYGEPSMTDNDTGHSEHDRVSPKNNAKASESPSDGNSNSQSVSNDHDFDSRNFKKVTSDKDEMLFDANAIDDVIEINKYLERNGSNCVTSPLTSTPRRKKSSPEHSSKDCDNKLIIINKEELETALQKCVKSLKNINLNHLVDLYDQLNRIVKKYSTLFDRSTLPAELLETVDKFVKALETK